LMTKTIKNSRMKMEIHEGVKCGMVGLKN